MSTEFGWVRMVAALAAGFLVTASPAHAYSVSGTDPYGVAWSLENTSPLTGPDATFLFALDFTNATSAVQNGYLYDFSIKTASSESGVTATETAGSWNAAVANKSGASGCTVPGSGFVCVAATSLTANHANNAFTTTFDIASSSFIGLGGEWSVAWDVLSDTGAIIDQASIAAPVPEPATYLMLLSGLAFLGFAVRRKNRPKHLAA